MHAAFTAQPSRLPVPSRHGRDPPRGRCLEARGLRRGLRGLELRGLHGRGRARGAVRRHRRAAHRGPARGRMPLHEPGLGALVAQETAWPAGCASRTMPARPRGMATSCSSWSVRRPMPRAWSTSRRVFSRWRAPWGTTATGDGLLVCKSTLPAGTADRVEAVVRDALARRGATHRIAVAGQPCIPASEGCSAVRDSRAPRPHRGRILRCRGDRAAGRALSLSVPARPRAPMAGDGPPLGRAREVRRQRDARHPHQLHERDGARAGAGGRRHREACAPRDRRRCAHRSGLPAGRKCAMAAPAS